MTNIHTFTVGDVVKLASEDKLMTVCSIHHNAVECVWFDVTLKPVYHEFVCGTLVLVKKTT